jgi:hypothetical protein
MKETVTQSYISTIKRNWERKRKGIENDEHDNLMEEKLKKIHRYILKMKKSFVDSENKPINGREREKSV